MSEPAGRSEKKILWVVSSFALGAPQRRLAALINGLTKDAAGRVYSHRLLALDGDYAATELLLAQTNWAPLQEGGAIKRKLGSGGFLLKKLWSSRQALAAERPDLLVTAGLGAQEWLAVNRGLKIAPHLHFQDPVGPEEAMEGAEGRGDWARRRALPSKGRLFVAGDAQTAALMVERWGVPQGAIRQLPWGVDLHALRPQLRDGAEVVFGGLTPLVPEKRHDRLLRILASLRERGRNAKVRLVGSGPERGRLETLAESLNLSEHVVFIDRDGLDPETAARETAQMDVFVDLAEVSRQPMAAATAMAAGLPMLAGADGAAAAIAPPENGLFLRSLKDESALAAAAELLAADPDLRRGVGAANRQAAENALSLGAMQTKFKALLDELLGADRLALPSPKAGEEKPKAPKARTPKPLAMLSNLVGAQAKSEAPPAKASGAAQKSVKPRSASA